MRLIQVKQNVSENIKKYLIRIIACVEKIKHRSVEKKIGFFLSSGALSETITNEIRCYYQTNIEALGKLRLKKKSLQR